jgi:hypothetical protein
VTAEPIAEAINSFAKHVREYKHVLVSDVGKQLTDREIEAHAELVESLCDELDVLADRSRAEDVTLAEFEAIRERLYAVNAVAPIGHLHAVQTAFINSGRLR